jgi:2-iminobutanoate/2-iminopropanoate deaminase
MKKTIKTDKAPKASAVYNQAVESNGTLFVSGQIALHVATGRLVEGGIREQTARALENLKAIIEAAGYSLTDVVKVNCILANIDDYPDMNEIYGKYFIEDAPARAAWAASKLPLGALIEMDAIAVKQ